MVIVPQVYTARVMHQRLFPKKNAFTYGVYYLVLPLPALNASWGALQFHAADVGLRDGSDPTPWARSTLAAYGLDTKVESLVLVTMPRVLGYVFNPVSFYLCLDEAGALIAVLCEVHNTFGEQHCYLCAHPDHRPLSGADWLDAEKVFHVSPFLERQGSYKFRFDLQADKLGIWIDYYDADGKKQLMTALTGSLAPLSRQTLRQAFWRHPLVTFKAIALIHWQAAKLILKGVRFISKPPQAGEAVSATRHLNKM